METKPLNIEDSAQLRDYLTSQGLFPGGIRISVLAGGVSGRTVLVQQPGGDAWVFKQALPALRVPVDWRSSPERAWREAEGARALASLLPPGAIPRVTFEDRSRHLFAMTAVPPSAANWKTLLMRGTVDPNHFRQCGQLLASLHRESSHRQAEFETQFSDLAYFESLRLEPYYEYTAAAVPGAAPFLLSLASDARTRKLSLVHGDFSPKNILLDQSLMVLLDHEVIHFGDPAFDIGFLLAHFLSKAHHLAPHRATLLEGISLFHQTYLESVRSCDWAPAAEPRAARHALGCLLARAAGRSQLEYLSEAERARQIAACVQLVPQPPDTIPELAHRFIKEIH